jgi:hypothetical protein
MYPAEIPRKLGMTLALEIPRLASSLQDDSGSPRGALGVPRPQ